jgi:ubiquinone/menaquinone biosynthesis C-methylase UbiE
MTRFVFLKEATDQWLAIEKRHLHGTYLDIGCDQGYASLVFNNYFSEIINLDLDRETFKSVKENGTHKRANTHFIIADAQALPFKNSSIDMATAFSVIEHLPDQDAFIDDVSRTIKKDGLFIIQVPNSNSLVELHTGMPFPALVTDKLWKLYCKYLIKITDEDYFINNLTNIEVTELCQPFFSSVCVVECNYTKESIPSHLRIFYSALKKSKILHILPLGWLVYCTKKKN